MRAVIQRVSEASVTVDGNVVGQIGPGLLVLLGIGRDDTSSDAVAFAEKIANLRIFSDDAGRFNLSLLDVRGAALVVSQFTLYADTRRGRRPSFTDAAAPDIAAPLVGVFSEALKQRGLAVANGVFGAHMDIALRNDGPVTIMLDTAVFKEARSAH
jgi:D-tyrosyl-tRNA(Tyr) deacylase